MNNIVNTTIAIIMLMNGILMTLIGFEIIKLKSKSPEYTEKMNVWRKKFGLFFKIAGIVTLISGIFLIISPDSEKTPANWTQTQKETLKKQMFNGSKLLQSINRDTADLVVECFVDKYTEKYSLQEAWTQDKLTQEQILEKMMPLLRECIELYGVKTNK